MKPSYFQNWVAQTPDDFVFEVKGPKCVAARGSKGDLPSWPSSMLLAGRGLAPLLLATHDARCSPPAARRYITHNKKLKDVETPLCNFLASGAWAHAFVAAAGSSVLRGLPASPHYRRPNR
jgi:hypothetical protein